MALLPKVLKVFETPGLQPDAPHAGVSEQEMAAQAQALYYRGCGSCLQWVYPDTSIAPAVAIAVGSSWLNVREIYDVGKYVNYEVGWRIMEGFSKITGSVTLAGSQATELSVRLVTCDITDNTTITNTGAASSPGVMRRSQGAQNGPGQNRQRQDMNEFGWVKGLHVLTKTASVDLTDIPADRRILVRPQIYLSAPWEDIATLAGTLGIYLIGFSLWDTTEDGV